MDMAWHDEDADAGAPRSADALASALVEARQYTLALYAHLDGAAQQFPRLATVNPPRWEIGHIGWFQEYWCLRDGGRSPSRLPHADAWWDSSRVAHDTRWSLDLPDWSGLHAYLCATLDGTLVALIGTAPHQRYPFELALYHEDMHGEALLMTLQTLGLPPPSWLVTAGTLQTGERAAVDGDVACAGGRFALGTTRERATRRFTFDNV
jgi:iron(II)-dependent oxidoreductase